MFSKIQFLAAAEKEFIEAAGYYNSQSPGLGFEFAAEVSTLLLVSLNIPLRGINYLFEPVVAELIIFLTALSIRYEKILL